MCTCVSSYAILWRSVQNTGAETPEKSDCEKDPLKPRSAQKRQMVQCGSRLKAKEVVAHQVLVTHPAMEPTHHATSYKIVNVKKKKKKKTRREKGAKGICQQRTAVAAAVCKRVISGPGLGGRLQPVR